MASASQKNMLPQVVILTSTIPKGLQEMLQGVLRYAQERGPWRIYQQERRRWMYPLQDLKEWGCTGIIGRLQTPELVRMIVGSRVPLVISYMSPNSVPVESYSKRHARICNDNAAIGARQ